MKLGRYVSVGTLALVMALSSSARAQVGGGTPKPPEPAASQNGDGKTKGGSTPDTTEFLQQFALGVGSMNLGREEVKKASLSGGVVRIDDSTRYRNSFWLQTSWIWALKNPDTASYFPSSLRPGVWAGLEMGADNKLASGIGAGFQLSFLQPGKSGEKGRSSLNIGYGWYRSTIQTLGEGIEAGKALPAGVETVPVRQQGVTGKMWMLSLNVTGF